MSASRFQGGATLREGDFASFFEAPFACYGRNSRYVSPLRGDLEDALSPHNPLFRDFAQRTWFTAHRGERIVGRILAHIHHASNRRHGLSRGYFGWFDCVDDAESAAALLGAAEDWLRQRGCDEVAGNFNATITQVIGVVTEGCERQAYTYQQANPAHVPTQLERRGYERFFPMRTFEIELASAEPHAFLGPRQRALLADRRWSFVAIRRRGLERRLREACGVLNDAFARNPLFVPLTEEEFLYPCKGLTWIVDETLSWTAYHDGEPAGIVLCIPDLNPFLRATRSRIGLTTPWHLLRHRRQRRRATMIVFAVRGRHQSRGVSGVLLHKMLVALRAGGYTQLGVTWVTDDNSASLRQMAKLRAAPLHRLHLFRRSL